jgi:hypothetical protein
MTGEEGVIPIPDQFSLIEEELNRRNGETERKKRRYLVSSHFAILRFFVPPVSFLDLGNHGLELV